MGAGWLGEYSKDFRILENILKNPKTVSKIRGKLLQKITSALQNGTLFESDVNFLNMMLKQDFQNSQIHPIVF